MRKRTVAIIAIAIIVMIAIPTSVYLYYFKMPITASPREIILEQDDLPQGWVLSEGGDGRSDSSIGLRFCNDTVTVGGDLWIIVLSLDSIDDAHEQYYDQGAGPGYADTHDWDLGDEGVYWFSLHLVEDPNGSYHDAGSNFTVYSTDICYLFREANVVVIMVFTTVGDGYGIKESWMDDIAELQADKAHEFDRALF